MKAIIKILSQKSHYQRLQLLQDQQSVQLFLFSINTQNNNHISYVLLDMVRRSAQLENTNIKFNTQQFVAKSQQLLNNSHSRQLLSYIFTKAQIHQLLNNKSELISIQRIQNIKQLNKTLQKCIVLSIKLPSQYFNSQGHYNLQGFLYNPRGIITKDWSFLNNSKITKFFLLPQNKQVQDQIKQNQIYSKNQLKTILEKINMINAMAKQCQISLFGKELLGLNDTFYHSEKFVQPANQLLPIILYQIQCLCSVTHDQTFKNTISTSAIQTTKQPIITICLNLDQGIQKCQQIINKKIQQIFSIENKYKQTLNRASISFPLTCMPTKLCNPHLFLKRQQKDKFSQYYIKGLYQYYHYGDNSFNDQGWGCAYRSLQSVLSWFRLQGMLALLRIPTIPQIQRLLDIIDCTSSTKLWNTSTWIGATQVSWIIKKLTTKDCRILHIKDGKDILEHVQMFRNHFENVGIPIMYGGDQYAYTIVGMDYSWKLGQVRFLVLDPHYNGHDKIDKIIQSKAIAWKIPQDMFKKGIFYNFCMPIL